MNIKRMRGRNNRGGGGFRSQQSGTPLNRNHVFDSNGPEQRVRGTAQQLQEKYQQMGRDAATSGDRVMAESYFQYAEHYFRIIAAMNQAQSHHAVQHSGQHASQGSQNGQGGYQNGSGGNGRRDETNEADQDGGDAPAGLGDQPLMESREIPIASAPPES